MVFRVLLVASAAMVLAGCSGVRPAAIFGGGLPERALVAPSAVQVAEVRPRGYRTLGSVSASCATPSRADLSGGVWLVDLACSQDLVVDAMKERVAAVGGDVLVGTNCRVERVPLLQVRCDAEVARRPGADPEGAKSVEVVESQSSNWRIRVVGDPRPPAERPTRRFDEVRELAMLPANQVKLSDLRATCERGCSEDEVRAGLVRAAGSVGGVGLVGARCAQQGEGWACQGTASGYEVDPLLDPRAR